MFRLLVTGVFAYVAYRVTRQMIDSVPDAVDPLLLPPSQHDREALRRQSVAMGIDLRR
ncbi:hypothetical protein [Mesorhizobium sp. INR15]|uniref:hypothetical protein n=1 Tax=Mesorhizobium sp. INR15 TaxID=2654248 RepID=UPI0018968093|nr:hypothetical protein [Mesorhizobium sp. INR15]